MDLLIPEKGRTSAILNEMCCLWVNTSSYCVDHNKLWKILKEMGMPDHLTCLLRNLHVGQEATVRTWTGSKLVKNLPAMQETQVRFLGWEDLLEKEMATHSHILAWRIPWTEEPGGLQSMESSQTQLSD